MGYAKLDMHRKVRSGFAEVIYCAGKADEHLLHIFERLYKADGQVFGTRATQHQYEILREKYPQVEYDPISHIIKIEKKDKIAIRENKRDKIFLWNRIYSGICTFSLSC